MHPDDLVTIRKRMRLTQLELADKLGMSVPTLSRLERSGAKIPLAIELAMERLQDIQPPRRHYLLDLTLKEFKPCTIAMAEAAHGVGLFSDTIITVWLACPGGHAPWPVPLKIKT